MGQEMRCRARIGGKVSDGKALLETNELIFRGDDGLRLKIPFKDVQSVEARDGELRFELTGGPAVFELGARAEKWAHKILNPKSLLDKLGVKRGMKVSVLGTGDKVAYSGSFIGDLQTRVPEVSLGIAAQESDLVFIPVDSAWDSHTLSSFRAGALKTDGAVWAIFRKGRKDFNENHVIRAGLEAGFVDVKVVRFSDTHTAMKFVIRKAERPGHSGP